MKAPHKSQLRNLPHADRIPGWLGLSQLRTTLYNPFPASAPASGLILICGSNHETSLPPLPTTSFCSHLCPGLLWQWSGGKTKTAATPRSSPTKRQTEASPGRSSTSTLATRAPSQACWFPQQATPTGTFPRPAGAKAFPRATRTRTRTKAHFGSIWTWRGTRKPKPCNRSALELQIKTIRLCQNIFGKQLIIFRSNNHRDYPSALEPRTSRL